MITLDYQNTTASRIGPEHGLTEEELRQATTAGAGLCRRFAEEADGGILGFAALPRSEEAARRVAEYAARRRGSVESFVQIGIGGSALGAIALGTALAHRFHNEGPGRPRFYVLDNVDPEETRALLERIDLRTTLFHVVTKSGDTTETMAGFLIVLDRLRKALGDAWRKNVVVTTDPRRGFLRKFAGQEGLEAFDVPEKVGGRFSVLTPVGLLPAAMLGVEIRDLLAGAREADALCRRPEAGRNPAFLFALVAYLLDTRRGKRIHVMMPYARALRDVADWFRQLWAESLGKSSRVGPTPVVALGTTDQHSQIQLYNEGPNDKLVIFLETGAFRTDERIPEVLPREAPPAFLQGRTLAEVMAAMKGGTEAALVQAQRPNMTLRLAEISARSLGGLFYLLEAATVYAGWLYGVDPFNQPGVEAGKRAAFARLGRPGYSAPPPPPPDPRYVVS